MGVDIARQGVDQSVIRFRRGLDARDTGRKFREYQARSAA